MTFTHTILLYLLKLLSPFLQQPFRPFTQMPIRVEGFSFDAKVQRGFFERMSNKYNLEHKRPIVSYRSSSDPHSATDNLCVLGQVT